jgi:hypothetical protein
LHGGGVGITTSVSEPISTDRQRVVQGTTLLKVTMVGVAPGGARACPSQSVENEILGSHVVDNEYSVVEANVCVLIQVVALDLAFLEELAYKIPERQHV